MWRKRLEKLIILFFICSSTFIKEKFVHSFDSKRPASKMRERERERERERKEERKKK